MAQVEVPPAPTATMTPRTPPTTSNSQSLALRLLPGGRGGARSRRGSLLRQRRSYRERVAEHLVYRHVVIPVPKHDWTKQTVIRPIDVADRLEPLPDLQRTAQAPPAQPSRRRDDDLQFLVGPLVRESGIDPDAVLGILQLLWSRQLGSVGRQVAVQGYIELRVRVTLDTIRRDRSRDVDEAIGFEAGPPMMRSSR
jgi:hypothetical protein